MKRKTITLVVYMLVCISLVSVGFAAWVITGDDDATATGNISATIVNDQSITIDNESWDGSSAVLTDGKFPGGEIVFGRPADHTAAANEGKWLQIPESDPKDKLKTVFSFTVSSGVNLSTAVKSSSVVLTQPDDLLTAQGKDYVSDVIFTVEVNSTTYDGSPVVITDGTQLATELKKVTAETTATVIITIEYEWGTLCGGVNPFNYYTGKEAKDYKKQAYDLLNGVWAANGDSFELAITITGQGA